MLRVVMSQSQTRNSEGVVGDCQFCFVFGNAAGNDWAAQSFPGSKPKLGPWKGPNLGTEMFRPSVATSQLLQWPGRGRVIERVVVYGYRFAPVTTGTIGAVGEVEPHIGWIHRVGRYETRSCGVAGIAVL